MPQPFKHNGNLKVDPARALSNPRFAEKVSLIAPYWQLVESRLSYSFAMLLGGEEDAALEIYNALIDRNLRKEAFLAAGKRRLPDELLREGARLFEKARRLASKRNLVAHGIWTAIDGHPDSIFLVDAKESLRLVHAIAATRGAYRVEDFEFTLMEYKVRDFTSIIELITEFYHVCDDYMWKVAARVERTRPRDPRAVAIPPQQEAEPLPLITTSMPLEALQTNPEPSPSPPQGEPLP